MGPIPAPYSSRTFVRVKHGRIHASSRTSTERCIFSANDGSNGEELWTSDGTDTGTVLVKDIRGGTNSANPSTATNVNGTLYFIANDGSNGEELWKSDGTDTGTMLAANVVGDTGTNRPREVTFAGDFLFFSTRTEDFGDELYALDIAAPEVVDIRVRGSSWDAGVSSFSLTNDTVGGPLPWTLNNIEIEFDEAVDSPTIDTVQLDRFSDTMPLARPVWPRSRGRAARSRVWTFTTPLATDKFTLVVSGERVTPSHQDTTGNLLLGGDKSQAFDVVLGDASRDGETTVTDLVVVTSHIGEEPTVASPFDVDGSGDVTVTDLVIVMSQAGEELPSLRQTVQLHVPQIGPGTTSILELNQIGDILENGVDRLLAARLGLTSAEAVGLAMALRWKLSICRQTNSLRLTA